MQGTEASHKFGNLFREREIQTHQCLVQFHKFIQNKFGYACKICDTLWFEGNLKNLIHDSVEFVRTFLQNVFTSAVWS